MLRHGLMPGGARRSDRTPPDVIGLRVVTLLSSELPEHLWPTAEGAKYAQRV